jgi:two-component system KDP operon response regulator KdpE
MSENRRIPVVDDEPQITRVLRRRLDCAPVRRARSGRGARQRWNLSATGSLIGGDRLSMPNMGGLELCRRLRAISNVPIIVLSVKGDERVKVEALDAGADDYVTKPFGMDELLARVRATLRRNPNLAGEASKLLENGHFRIDVEARKVTLSGREVHLTPKEFDLLVHLVRHAGKVLTHRSLLAAVWGGDYVEQTEYLRVFIGQLRKKIEPHLATPQYILTEPWIGYRFEPGD